MYRIMAPDDSVAQPHYLRFVLATAYAMFSTAGVLLVLSPIVATAYGLPVYIYSSFLALGGLLAMLGAVTRCWTGEFTGLPLLISAFGAFGVEIVAHEFHAAPGLAIANFLFFAGTSVLLSVRWRTSIAAYRLARHVAELRHEGLGSHYEG